MHLTAVVQTSVVLFRLHRSGEEFILHANQHVRRGT